MRPDISANLDARVDVDFRYRLIGIMSVPILEDPGQKVVARDIDIA